MATQQPTPQGELHTHTQVLVIAAVFLTLIIGAGVGLALAGWKAEAIIGLLTGLVGVGAVALPLLDRVMTVDRKQDTQQASLARITEQTNGGLDRRILDNVNTALDARFGTSKASMSATSTDTPSVSSTPTV